MLRERSARGALVALLGITLLGTAFWTVSCSKKGGTDAADDDNAEDNPPSRVTDLTVTQVTSASVTLRWTAPNGGSPTMMASSYDMRGAASLIDGSNWANAFEIAGEPGPASAGTVQTMVITGVPADTTLYFALRTSNPAGLWSEVSNSPPAVVPPETGVAFADSALEAAIRGIVQKPEGDLLPADLAGVQEIQVNERGIHSLDGLQYCVSLTRLGIHANAVTDLSPLAGLTNLVDLDASANDISDLQPLAGHVSLMNLLLDHNAIHDIGPLQALERLNVLRLDGNEIVNIAPVAGCFRLNHLFMANNQIVDLAPLTGLVYLANLDLAGNAIVDLAPLVSNTGFGSGDQIWVAGNPLSATAVNEQIPALRARGAVVYDH
jgi:Leucine-rich repeat (LRR) protein